MRTPILLAGVFAALLTAPLTAANEEAALKEIRAYYAKIDQGKPVKTTKIKFDLEGDPMEGTITHYTYEGGLSAIKLSYIAGDHGGSDEHFYYKDSALFFIFVKDQHWRFGGGGPAEKPNTVDFLTETRYYVRDGKCVRALKRTAKDADAKKLPGLIAKEKNRKIAPGEDLTRFLTRAKAMLTITNGKEAAKFFAEES